MSAKILLILSIAVTVLAISASATTCTSSSPHSVNFGTKNYRDQMLYMDQPKMEKKLLRVVTKDITYPVQGNITYIEISDDTRSSKGGCASILSGGIGSNHVTLHLKSQRGLPFSFTVKIWGQRKW